MAPCHLLTSIALFLSTSPAWGTTCTWPPGAWPLRNFYPRPPRGGRRGRSTDDIIAERISIHVPRVGDDRKHLPPGQVVTVFLSTSPAWGTTPAPAARGGAERIFLSTSPAWGTTPTEVMLMTYEDISIHVPRVGDDKAAPYVYKVKNKFLSTSPAWGTTCRLMISHCFPICISIHVPRVGDDFIPCTAYDGNIHFYPRPPRGGRLRMQRWGNLPSKYFYPRPPRGGRLISDTKCIGVITFLSTSPAWGTTNSCARLCTYIHISIHVPRVGDDYITVYRWQRIEYFYPRPPRGGRPTPATAAPPPWKISIHVPRVGDDAAGQCLHLRCWNFYPRPPRGGRLSAVGFSASIMVFLSTSPAWGTTLGCSEERALLQFLSTSPAWGTTRGVVCENQGGNDFYPRPPRGGRLYTATIVHLLLEISIHVPRVGDDRYARSLVTDWANFYPRPPRGGRLSIAYLTLLPFSISIHVPRVGDDRRSGSGCRCTNISIHVPRVGDDAMGRYQCPDRQISIHVPRVGDDARPSHILLQLCGFLSTSPAWGTTYWPSHCSSQSAFLSTSPAWGTTHGSISMPRPSNFYPRPPRGGRLKGVAGQDLYYVFLSTSPAWGTTHRHTG